jgi:glycine/D-amino acid oxidase-like deaminating enzyme
MLTRRQTAASLLSFAAPVAPQRIAVIGAGAFGAWTAYFLQKAGHNVTLLDQDGPANARASSGGESRIIRARYG